MLNSIQHLLRRYQTLNQVQGDVYSRFLSCCLPPDEIIPDLSAAGSERVPYAEMRPRSFAAEAVIQAYVAQWGSDSHPDARAGHRGELGMLRQVLEWAREW